MKEAIRLIRYAAGELNRIKWDAETHDIERVIMELYRVANLLNAHNCEDHVDRGDEE